MPKVSIASVTTQAVAPAGAWDARDRDLLGLELARRHFEADNVTPQGGVVDHVSHVIAHGALEGRVGIVVGSHPGHGVLGELLAHLLQC